MELLLAVQKEKLVTSMVAELPLLEKAGAGLLLSPLDPSSQFNCCCSL